MPEVNGTQGGGSPWWQTNTQKTTEPTDQFGKDAFLKLLVAQLRYQNPMSPMDGNEFLAQTAQFTMVEKIGDVAAQTKEIAASQGVLQAAALIGRSVTYSDITGASRSGVVSSARFEDIGPLLRVGNDDVPLSLLRSVAASEPRPATDPTPTDSQPTD
jgi:flagellar basal-body rod modification protein FlgD